MTGIDKKSGMKEGDQKRKKRREENKMRKSGKVSGEEKIRNNEIKKRISEVERIIRENRDVYPVSEFIKRKKGSGGVVDVVVKTVLSQNTSDNLRDIAFENLKRKYGDLMRILSAPSSEVEELVRVCGLPKVKVKRIKNVLFELRKLGDPENLCKMGYEKAFSFLSSISGIGPKSAEVILAFGCGFDTFPVDTHVARIMRRLGIADGSREKIYYLVSPHFKNKIFSHVFLIHHGRRICRAKNPLCDECFFLKICDFGRKKIGVRGNQ